MAFLATETSQSKIVNRNAKEAELEIDPFTFAGLLFEDWFQMADKQLRFRSRCL